MHGATLTSKGQVTLPKEIREFLKVRTGDRIDFVIERDGRVLVKAATVHASELKGLLHRPGRKAVSLDAMDRAIRRRHERSR